MKSFRVMLEMNWDVYLGSVVFLLALFGVIGGFLAMAASLVWVEEKFGTRWNLLLAAVYIVFVLPALAALVV